jgi:hypothetical protein
MTVGTNANTAMGLLPPAADESINSEHQATQKWFDLISACPSETVSNASRKRRDIYLIMILFIYMKEMW